MQYSHETKMDAVCAEAFASSTLLSGISFRALNQKLLKCEIIVVKGLTLQDLIYNLLNHLLQHPHPAVCKLEHKSTSDLKLEVDNYRLLL